MGTAAGILEGILQGIIGGTLGRMSNAFEWLNKILAEFPTNTIEKLNKELLAANYEKSQEKF